MTAENRRIRHIATTRATTLGSLRTGLLSWLTDADEDTLAISPDGTSLRRLARRDAGNLFSGLQRFANGLAGAVGQALTLSGAIALSALTGPCLLAIDAASQIAATALTVDNVARKDLAQGFQGLQTFGGGIADSTLTAGRVLFAGPSGRHSGSSHLSWDDTNRVLQIGAASSDGKAALDVWHYDGATTGAIRGYNPTPSLGATLGYDIDFRDAANARQTYGRFLSTIRDATAGAHQGRVALQAARAGTLTSVLRAGDLADLCGAGAEGLQVAYGSLFIGNSVLADASRNVTAASVAVGTSTSASGTVTLDGAYGAVREILYRDAGVARIALRLQANNYDGLSVLMRNDDGSARDTALALPRDSAATAVLARYFAAQLARVGNWSGGATTALFSRASFDGATWSGMGINANGRTYFNTAAGQPITFQQAGATSDLATFQDSGILLNRATTINGALTIGSTPRITLDGAGSLTTLGLTGVLTGTSATFSGTVTALVSGTSRTIAFGSTAGTFAEGSHTHETFAAITTFNSTVYWGMSHPGYQPYLGSDGVLQAGVVRIGHATTTVDTLMIRDGYTSLFTIRQNANCSAKIAMRGRFGFAIEDGTDIAPDTWITRPSANTLRISSDADTGAANLEVQGRMSAGTLLFGSSAVPASATASGAKGEIRYDASYVYICTASNTWKRATLSTW